MALLSVRLTSGIAFFVLLLNGLLLLFLKLLAHLFNFLADVLSRLQPTVALSDITICGTTICSSSCNIELVGALRTTGLLLQSLIHDDLILVEDIIVTGIAVFLLDNVDLALADILILSASSKGLLRLLEIILRLLNSTLLVWSYCSLLLRHELIFMFFGSFGNGSDLPLASFVLRWAQGILFLRTLLVSR